MIHVEYLHVINLIIFLYEYGDKNLQTLVYIVVRLRKSIITLRRDFLEQT